MWGDNQGGDLAADGKGNWRIKNSYVDFNLGMVNAKVGIQGATIARGFVFADDFSGAVVTADFGMVKVPVLYALASNQDDKYWDTGNSRSASFITVLNCEFITDGTANVNPNIAFGNTAGDGDVHILSVMPQVSISDAVMVTPHFTWANVTSQDTYIYWLGVDADLKFDAVSAWATGIYNGGTIDGMGAADTDISAYLFAAGADAGIVHGQAFYASGDDDNCR